MHRFKLAVLLCEPTLFSGTATVFAAVALMAFANFSYLLRSGLIYDALFGKNSPLDLIQSSHDTFSAISATIFGNTLLNRLLFFGFWMMVGLLVYVSIMALGQTLAETGNDVRSLRYIHARKNLIEHNFLVRTAIRTSGIIAALLYGWVFTRLLFPFCIFASRVGLDELPKPIGWFYLALASVVLVLSIHTFVIIGRLIAVRPRVFGDWDSLLTNKK